MTGVVAATEVVIKVEYKSSTARRVSVPDVRRIFFVVVSIATYSLGVRETLPGISKLR